MRSGIVTASLTLRLHPRAGSPSMPCTRVTIALVGGYPSLPVGHPQGTPACTQTNQRSATETTARVVQRQAAFTAVGGGRGSGECSRRTWSGHAAGGARGCTPPLRKRAGGACACTSTATHHAQQRARVGGGGARGGARCLPTRASASAAGALLYHTVHRAVGALL